MLSTLLDFIGNLICIYWDAAPRPKTCLCPVKKTSSVLFSEYLNLEKVAPHFKHGPGRNRVSGGEGENWYHSQLYTRDHAPYTRNINFHFIFKLSSSLHFRSYTGQQFLKSFSGDVGPFKPGLPVSVPLWLAVNLRQRQRCRLVTPGWLQVERLEEVIVTRVSCSLHKDFIVGERHGEGRCPVHRDARH